MSILLRELLKEIISIHHFYSGSLSFYLFKKKKNRAYLERFYFVEFFITKILIFSLGGNLNFPLPLNTKITCGAVKTFNFIIKLSLYLYCGLSLGIHNKRGTSMKYYQVI